MTSAEIIEKIKRVLLDPEGATQGSLAKLATEYALNCRRLNANVERALSTYRSGSLSDSDRILEEYAVFEEFQRLNFDGKDDWREVCRTLGFDIAILPPAQTIEELHAFNVLYERTRELFSQQRRLALEGGSNAKRLQILYTLESTFPQYSIWKTPIKDLERERVTEITGLLKATTKQNVDASFITGALQELEDAKRRSRAPEELLNNLRSWKEYIDKTSSLKRLRILLDEWRKAKESNDDFQALACLQYFRDENLSKAKSVATKEELELLNALALDAQKIERRETARVQLKRKSRELSRALETDSNADRLSDLFASTELESDKAGESLDPSVTRAYRQRMEALETQRRRKRLAFVLALSLALVLFGAASTLIIKRAQTKRNVETAVAELTSKLRDFEGVDGTNGRVEALAEAEEIVQSYEKQNEDILNSPDYLQTLDRVKNARAQEDRRLHEFKDVALKISNAHKENRAAPSLVNNLERRCRTEQERRVYLKLKQKDAELKRETDANNLRNASQKLEDLIAAEKALEESQNLTEGEIKLEISRIKRGLEELKQIENNTELPEIQTQVKAQKELEAILDEFEKRFLEKRQEDASTSDSTDDSEMFSDSDLEAEFESTQEPVPESEQTFEPIPNTESKTESNSTNEGEDDAFTEALESLAP